jgi:BirA family biotin operon repressor/biotin-[acetyl-CoA-carboxylase] ligase
MYNIIKFDTLPSTNKYLKEYYNQYDEFTVITTDNQTNGKGRMTRVWNSTKDYLTF